MKSLKIITDIEDIINRSSLDDIPDDKINNFVQKLLLHNFSNNVEFNNVLREVSKICKIMPSKTAILQSYKYLLKNNQDITKNNNLIDLCTKKSVRSESGVLVITVLTSPYPEYIAADGSRKRQSFSCGENCSYCPNEPEIIINTIILDCSISLNKHNYIVSVSTTDSMAVVRVFNYIEFPEYNIILDRINIKNIKENVSKDREIVNIFDIEINANKIDYLKLQPGTLIKGIKGAQPRSYVSSESGVMRGNQNHFDAFYQFIDRISALEICGHPPDKIEILVLGGTWSDYPLGYKDEFIRDLHYAANVYNEVKDGIKRERYSLEKEIELNMTASCRIIGLTLETRPDRITKREIKNFRKYNCTRVQLGVQHIDDSVLKMNNRNCYTKDTINSLLLLKDNGFKVDTHFMPDLPGSNFDLDKEMFHNLLGIKKMKNDFKAHFFEYELLHPELQSDQWKIYPTEVTRWTDIKKWYDEGTYKPYGENEEIMKQLILKIKIDVFPWIRLNRVVRDFEFNSTVLGGNPNPSLRDDLHRELAKMGEYCKCIRCREVGHMSKQISLRKNINILKNKFRIEDIYIKEEYSKIYLYYSEKKRNETNNIKIEIVLVIRKYNTKGGIEYFLSYETIDYKILFGFLRLRINDSNNNVFFKEIENSGLIRELHVYGSLVKHNDSETKKTQHIGFGKKLINKAEEITYNNNLRKITVISGIGVREYYSKRGYQLNGTYMIKKLEEKNILTKLKNIVIMFKIYINYLVLGFLILFLSIIINL